MQIMMEEHIYFFCTQFGKKSPTGKGAVNDVKINENKLKNEKDNSDEKSNVQENNQAQNVTSSFDENSFANGHLDNYPNYGEQYDITPELIWMIYEGKDITNEKYIFPDFLFLKSFMDGELDCDKMDYLLRDSLYCGVTYGKYDLNRFVSTLTAYKHDNQIQLAIERGGIQALEEFVLARYFMFIQVYFHKTRRYLDKALVKSLKAVLPNGKYPEDIQEYLKWDDIRVLNLFADSDDPNVIGFRNRNIMTCVFESKAHAEKAEKKNTNLVFQLLYKEFGDQVLLDSVDKTAHKLSPVLLDANDDSGKGIMILDEKTGLTTNLMEESIILESIVVPISINRIYANKDVKAAVLKRIEDINDGIV